MKFIRKTVNKFSYQATSTHQWTLLWSKANMQPGSLCEQRSSDYPRSGWRLTTRGACGWGSARRTSTWGAFRTCRPCERARGRAPSRGRGRPQCLTKKFEPYRRRPRWRVGHLPGPKPRGDDCELGPEFWEFKFFLEVFYFSVIGNLSNQFLSAKVISDWPRFSIDNLSKKAFRDSFIRWMKIGEMYFIKLLHINVEITLNNFKHMSKVC